jgi:hypothetical protein
MMDKMVRLGQAVFDRHADPLRAVFRQFPASALREAEA